MHVPSARPFPLLAALALLHPAAAAAAPFAYVPNEKGGTVSVIDTATDKVVGEIEAGVKPRGLAVSRDGKLVAKARVTSVRQDRCVASLVPGWEFSEVLEGDIVTPAHPGS